MLRIALMPKYLNAWTRLLRRAPVLAQVFSLRNSKSSLQCLYKKNSHQSVNMAVTFQVYLAKPLWRISSSWAQLARPCRQSLLCFASHHLLQHLESRVLWRKTSGLVIFRGVGSCAQEGTGAKVAHVTFEQTIDTHYFNQHLLISSAYLRSLKLSEKGLAWVLGLHVDLRSRVGQVEAKRGGEGGGEGCSLLFLLLVKVLSKSKV